MTVLSARRASPRRRTSRSSAGAAPGSAEVAFFRPAILVRTLRFEGGTSPRRRPRRLVCETERGENPPTLAGGGTWAGSAGPDAPLIPMELMLPNPL